MRALALVVLLSCVARAADPVTDAPVILEAGQAAPARGLFKPEARAIRDEAAAVGCVVERDDLRVKAAPLWWVPVVVAAIALGAGVGIGVGISEAGKK